MSDLEVLFHNISDIEKAVVDQLDNQIKGHVELDDLVGEVTKHLQSPYSDLLINYIQTLEYKNTDKIFYSPLIGSLPPFFRYAKRFDSFGVIEKLARELSSIDTHSTGFVPV